MASFVNDLDLLLQATSPRVNVFDIPSNANYTGDTSGNHTGNLNGLTTQSVIDAAFASSGDITADVLSNSATAITVTSSNLFSMPGSGSAGTFIGAGGITATNSSGTTTFSISSATGDAFFGGTLIASQVISGTFVTDRIPVLGTSKFQSGSVTNIILGSNAVSESKIQNGAVTVDKLNVVTLSAITANLGTVNAGSISGSANININGQGKFEGSTSSSQGSAAIVGNESAGTTRGVIGFGSTVGVSGYSTGGTGILGRSTGGGAGVNAIGVSGSNALVVTGHSILGTVSMSTQTISNLTVGNATNASNATNATNASNANSLGGTAASGWCRGVACNVGTATASAFGFGFVSTVSGVETAATGGNNYRVRSISDRRKKREIQREKLGLDFVMKLNPVSYRMKNNPALLMHGVITQDIEALNMLESDDSLAYTHEDGSKGTDYNSLEGPMIKAIQQLSEQVEQLKKEISILKKKII